jgi:small Trp-rich protein
MIVLSPFLGAVLWWMWADATGYTKKKAMQAMAARQAARREQQMVNLGQSKAGGKHRR